MATLYLDHDVPLQVAHLLGNSGHFVMTARALDLDAASDELQLLSAYRNRAILVTRNRKDFLLLHRAWLTWSHEWGASATHSGIVLVPHQYEGEDWTPPLVSSRILMLLMEGLPRENELYHWQRTGWTRAA